MSTGLVICSTCRREVHQDGDREVRRGWTHCWNRTPICVGAEAIYPRSESEIEGLWCGRDGFPPGYQLSDNPMANLRLFTSPHFGDDRLVIGSGDSGVIIVTDSTAPPEPTMALPHVTVIGSKVTRHGGDDNAGATTSQDPRGGYRPAPRAPKRRGAHAPPKDRNAKRRR